MKNLSDEEHAYNKGQELIKIISSNLTEDKLTCSIGIALVDDKDSFNNIFNHLYRITKFENASCTMLNSDEY